LLRASRTAAGGSTDNIAQVSFFFATFSASIMREVVNPLWEKMFTDANERPTYKFMPAPNLPAGREVHCEFWAVLGEKRRSIQIPGVSHTNPIPFGVRMGRYLFSSRCLPADPATGRNPEGMERQLECSLGNASTLLDLAGMKWPDVSGGRAFVSNLDYVPAVTAAWNARFDGSKPAPLRPVLYGAGGNAHVYVEFIAEAGG
jgi:2-iminobutanoate/2-iminopropanoate deaminase